MSDDRRPDDDDLHAYADGRLSGEAAKAVERRLVQEPAARARLAAYRHINAALHRGYDRVLDEPIPPAMLTLATAPRRWPAIAASIAVALTLGFLGGWLVQPRLAPPPALQARLAPPISAQAANAHAIYSVEVRHPVEVEASEEAHLVRWLSNRMGRQVVAPRLDDLGYRLVGGRLLPSAEGGVACQFMYENVGGGRVTLFIKTAPAGQAASEFRFVIENQGVSVFTWLDARFGYALSGTLEREELLRLARKVHEQISA